MLNEQVIGRLGRALGLLIDRSISLLFIGMDGRAINDVMEDFGVFLVKDLASYSAKHPGRGAKPNVSSTTADVYR